MWLRSVVEPRGPTASTIADLWWLMLILGTAIVAAVVLILVVGLRRNGSVSSDSSRFWILVWGVGLPAVVICVVLGATIGALRSTASDVDATTMRIEVTGHQWWWEVEYATDGFATANEVHIPVDEPVALELRSADVIHSFWVPALAGKMDALPERTNTLVIEASEPGRYAARCAEFCGLQHANMDLFVVAHTRADFDTWTREQQQPARRPSTTSERTGFELVTGERCASCHTIRGTDAAGTAGPDLTHIGSRTALAGGLLEVSTVDLVTWITDPHAVKPEVDMPAADLDADAVEAIAIYLESLT